MWKQFIKCAYDLYVCIMRKLSLALTFVFMLMGCVGCSANVSDDKESKNIDSANIFQSKTAPEIYESSDNLNADEYTLYIKVGDSVLEAELSDNSSSEALVELLKKSDITINMSDYADFEKVGELGASLPTNDEQITTKAGDLILYQGNKFVIYYDTNSWSLTKLGEIKNVSQSELKSILGGSDITVTLTLKK